MENQISKQAILSFLNERLEVRNNRIEEINSMECSTQSEKSYRMYSELTNYSKIELLEDLIGNIERGMFDETEYITYPNGAMIDKKITSDLDISK
jgi:hypothetical protein